MEWIKNFCLEILNKFKEHIAAAIAGVLIALILTILLVFKEWVKAEHSVKLYCWLWIAVVILIALLPFLISWLFTRPKYKNEEDVKNVLSAYLRHCTNDKPIQENTFRFNAVDKLQKLKKGSSKKYFKDVINETIGWSIINEGNNTIRVKKDSIQNVFGGI